MVSLIKLKDLSGTRGEWLFVGGAGPSNICLILANRRRWLKNKSNPYTYNKWVFCQ